MGPGMNKRNKKKKFAKSRTTNINMEKEFQMFFNSMNQELDKELDKDVFRKKNKKKGNYLHLSINQIKKRKKKMMDGKQKLMKKKSMMNKLS